MATYREIYENLLAERAKLDMAIRALEPLVIPGKRRGRPPKWLTEAKNREQPPAPDGKGRRRFSADARKRMSDAQRDRWAAKRAGEPEPDPNA